MIMVGVGRQYAGTAEVVPVRVLMADDVARARQDEAAATDTESLTRGITAFGHALVHAVSTPSTNVVVSPLSVAYAFAMARAGARGQTGAELDATFGFPGAATHSALDALTRPLGATGEPPADRHDERAAPVLAIANGLFAAADADVRPDYLATLARHYGTGLRLVDFTAPGTVAEINDWVSQQTAGRIARLFTDLPRDTRLVLANAVYLWARWADPFRASDTSDRPFHRGDGTTIRVPMMAAERRLRYAQGAEWQAVELPYAGAGLAMRVIVPTGARSPVELLEPALLDEVGSSLREGTVRLRLPRWDMSSSIELLPALRGLGLAAPFDPRVADFGDLLTEQVAIGQAVHRANITVAEWGTEAAAATGLAFVVAAFRQRKPDAVITADRPFAFTVVQRATGLPLFSGQVADPR